jgi:chromosome segregation ATPase
MGRVGLPPITKLEEVLDLLTDPAKYKRYLDEFKAIYDETRLSLGDLQTKEQADVYLATADDTRNAAYKILADAKVSADKAYEEVKILRDEQRELHAEIQEERKEVGKATVDLKAAQDAFDKYKAEGELYLQKQREEITAKQQEIDELSAKVDAKRLKLEEALKA